MIEIFSIILPLLAVASPQQNELDSNRVLAAAMPYLECVEPFDREREKIWTELNGLGDRAAASQAAIERTADFYDITLRQDRTCDSAEVRAEIVFLLRSRHPDAPEEQIELAAVELLRHATTLHKLAVKFDEGNLPQSRPLPPQAPRPRK